MSRAVTMVLALAMVIACGGNRDASNDAAPELTLHDGIIVEPVLNDVAAVYIMIRSSADQPDTLLSVESTLGGAEIHDQVRDGDMVHMQHRSHLVIPAHGEVALEPGGLHLMLDVVAAPVVAGDSVEMVFQFAASGEHRVTLPVVSYGDLP